MEKTHHKTVAAFYDDVYYKDARIPSGHSRHLRGLAKRLGVAAGQSILDVACGTGNWLAIAEQKGAVVSGVDISKQAIGICRERLPGGDFHVCTAEALPYPDNQFDLVTCLGSLEHFLDQPAALKEMIRVAKPSAKFLILVPNAGFPLYRLRVFSGTYQQVVRETIRPLSEWQGLFSQAGLHVQLRWKDLHIVSRSWIVRPPWYLIPLRFLQAMAMPLWPLGWQYQVYHLCVLK